MAGRAAVAVGHLRGARERSAGDGGPCAGAGARSSGRCVAPPPAGAGHPGSAINEFVSVLVVCRQTGTGVLYNII